MAATFDYDNIQQVAHVELSGERITVGDGSITLTQDGVATKVSYNIGYDSATKSLVMNDPTGQLTLNHSATDGYSISAAIPYAISERGKEITVDATTTTGRLPADVTVSGIDKQDLPYRYTYTLWPQAAVISSSNFKAGTTVSITAPDIGLDAQAEVFANGLFSYPVKGDFSTWTVHFNTIVDWGVVCFLRGTMIETEVGPVPVEALMSGMNVMTRDHGFQPIRWIGSASICAATLAVTPSLRPIRIRKDALAANIPNADLMVSPQHRVLVRSKIAERLFGASEVLVAAKQLLSLDGIEIAEDLPEVEYFHILFDQHEIILSNGAETESLYTGVEALKFVGPAARKEIFAIFPELNVPAYQAHAAREIVPGRNARKLAGRHQTHSRPLVN